MCPRWVIKLELNIRNKSDKTENRNNYKQNFDPCFLNGNGFEFFKNAIVKILTSLQAEGLKLFYT